MQLVHKPDGVKAMLQASLPSQCLGLAWLGQAGFAMRYGSHRLLMDPYLSDHLALKHAGSDFSHARLMPPPLSAEEFQGLDLVLCSHRHGDHMDPGSLPTLARNNPACRFVVPRAEMEFAVALGLKPSQLLPIDDGETNQIAEDLEVQAVASAHEALETDSKGRHRFLGFILRFVVRALTGKKVEWETGADIADDLAKSQFGPRKGGAPNPAQSAVQTFTLYHSGDCVIYEGLAERLRAWPIDLALLPVNGRNPRLSAQGIAGNMTFEEARAFCLSAGIHLMIPHHFGMFAFNSAELPGLEQQIAQLDRRTLRCVIPATQRYYLLTK